MTVGYLVQGLRSNSLVAGKTTVLRMIVAPFDATKAKAVEATIVRPDGSTAQLTWSGSDVHAALVGKESVCVSISGNTLSAVGLYYISATILTGDGSVAASALLDGVSLLPTKDLRMMVSRIWSGAAAEKPGEVQAAIDAMTRLSFLYPVRDGFSSLNGDYNAGLRFDFQNDPQGPPNQDGNIEPLWDAFHSPPPGKDTLDCALVYRFPDAGEGSGARTHDTYKGWLPNSGIVWTVPLAHVFCHETGHNNGLESPSSPHFDSTGQASHSKDVNIDANDAADGFDIQFMAPFVTPTLDIMFPSGGSEPPGQLSLNGFDWEAVRQNLLKHNSTGPLPPTLDWSSLGGHDLRPSLSAIRNQDGRLEVFVLGGDRALYHIWERAPGAAWQPWSTLEGHDLRGSIVTIKDAVGAIHVFVVGGDGHIYSRAQVAANGGWGPWTGLNGKGVRGLAASMNKDGRLELVAVFGDGQLYDIAMDGSANWSGWVQLQGHDLKGPVALAQNKDGRLQAFVVGGDGGIYHRAQLQPNGNSGWSPWTILVDPKLRKVDDLRAELSGSGTIVVVFMKSDQSIGYVMQNAPDGQWGAMFNLEGHDLKWPCSLARADDGRLEVGVVGGNRQLYSRWQVDSGRPTLWANWTTLGGHDLQAGLALSPNAAGQIEIFVIGGDGALYRGAR